MEERGDIQEEEVELPPPVKVIKVGEQFRDVSEVKEYIKTFNKEHFCEFIVGTNNSKSLYFVCTSSRCRKYSTTTIWIAKQKFTSSSHRNMEMIL